MSPLHKPLSRNAKIGRPWLRTLARALGVRRVGAREPTQPRARGRCVLATYAEQKVVGRFSAGAFHESDSCARRARVTVSRPTATAGAILALSGLLGVGQVSADEPIAPPKCALRLSVEVTPDVPNPGDGGFISSLLGDHASYQLFLLQVVDDTHVNLQLQGPGPAERCQAVVASISNDGRVASVQVY